MRGSLLTAFRRWTSTPTADGDLLSSSPRSGALRTGAAWPPARLTDAATGLTEFGSARLPTAAPRAAALAGGVNGAGAVGLVSLGGATDGDVWSGEGGATDGGGCVDGGGWT